MKHFNPMRIIAAIVLFIPLSSICAPAGELRWDVKPLPDGVSASIVDEKTPVFTSQQPQAAISILQPAGPATIRYENVEQRDKSTKLHATTPDGLVIDEELRALNAQLLERTVTVTAKADQRYLIDFGWRVALPGDFYSFTGKEAASKSYSPGCGGPEFQGTSTQTFPLVAYRHGDTVYGIIGESPGLWENRSFLKFDVENRVLSVFNGDGSAKRAISIPRAVDATTVYRATFDGWQHIEAGETQVFKTWIFASPVKTLYDIQLAAHLALANAKGFNRSGLEAILRNTSYLLLRRNVLRAESDYIFISGVGYGWKQWVSDGFWMSRGLDDPKFDAEAMNAVFFERLNYEDNSQYYLIWACLVKRAGGTLDERTVRRAYDFIRKNEVDGLYVPPRLKPDTPQFRTYHDLLPYDDDDSPTSNQGFHCGALMAAKELGLPVTDADIDRAIAGYRSLFNQAGGYMPTSRKQQNHIGQDVFYGEVLTFAVFGRKLLDDDVVRRHLETTMRIQSPYGMRVISKANGELLEGHSGEYVFGGSWFLNDGANYLDGLIHGMEPNWVDEKLLWRLEKELAFMPAFHESISTVTGRPHGHHLYSWNSGFWWLRREVRNRLGLTGADPLEAALDARLGVASKDGHLVLDPARATLRTKE